MTASDVFWIVVATAVAGVLRWLEARFPAHRHEHKHDTDCDEKE